MSRNGHTGAFVFGLIVGGISSAAATLLLTPKSGDDLRGELATRGQRLQEQAKATAEDVRRRAEELRGQSQQLAQTYAGTVSDVTDPAQTADEATAVVTAEGVETITGDAAARVDAAAQATAEQSDATGEEAVAAAAEAVEEAARDIKESAEAAEERADDTRRDLQ